MAVKFKDYYETLGVARDASEADVKKAFRKLAREFHPDVAKDKKTAEARFKEINEAYEVLSDVSKRKKYDALGADWKAGAEFRPPPGWQPFGEGGFRTQGRSGAGGAEFHFGGTGFSDFFEQFFGSAGRGGAGRFDRGTFANEPVAERGRDIEGDLMVTLEEAARGAVRVVSLQRPGTCLACGGTGQRNRRPCPSCRGEGAVAQVEEHKVRIPAGVTEGQLLRVAGRGEAGSGGGGLGDLLLRVRFARHPDFEVSGHDLTRELELAPWEAVLGATISVPTLGEPVSIRIPPGTQNGHKLRVRGRGLSQRDGGSGDLYVTARIEVPVRIGDKERELWEKLARESRFNPRD
jgi:curved DNA-binding protein